MRKFVLLVLCVLVCFPLFADTNTIRVTSKTLRTATLDTTFPVGASETIYSKSFSLRGIESAGLIFKPAGSIIGMEINLYQSFVPPATEGTYDSRYVLTDALVSNNNSDSWQYATVDTLATFPYGVIQVVGSAANTNNNTIVLKWGSR